MDFFSWLFGKKAAAETRPETRRPGTCVNLASLIEVISTSEQSLKNFVLACEKELISLNETTKFLKTDRSIRVRASDFVNTLQQTATDSRSIDIILCILKDKGGIQGSIIAQNIAKEYGLCRLTKYTRIVNEELNYYRLAVEEHGSIDVRAIKWLLVGPPQVGKTTTLQRLLNQRIRSTSTSTGIESPVEINIDLKDYNTEATVLSAQSHWRRYNTKELMQILLNNIKKTSQAQRNISPMSAHRERDVAEDSNSTDLNPYDRFTDVMKFISDHINDPNFQDAFEDSVTVYITDTGGQPEFHEVLPILLRGPALYLVFFSLAQKLNEKYTVCYRSSNSVYNYRYVSTYTISEVLCRLLSHLYHLRYEAGPRADQKLSQVSSQAVLLATFADSSCDSIKSFDEKIKSMLLKEFHSNAFIRDSSKFDYETCFIPLDNTQCTNNCEELKKLQSYLSEASKSVQPVSLPINWFVFHLFIRSQQKKVMKFSECMSLAQQCKLVDEEVFKALDYIHHYLGTILFYNVENLNEIVICDPGVLLKAISNVVASSFNEKEKKDIILGGEIKEDYLKKRVIGEKRPHPVITAEYVINLMKHLKIMVQLDKDTYFMPCLLPPLNKKSHINVKKFPLLVSFQGDFIPFGVLSTFLSTLISTRNPASMKWVLIEKKKRTRESISFLVNSKWIIELVVRRSYFELYFRSKPDNNNIYYKVYCDIKVAFENAVAVLENNKKLVLCFGLYCHFKASCFNCYENPHFAEFKQEHSVLSCNEHEDCSNNTQMRPEEKQWFIDEQNASSTNRINAGCKCFWYCVLIAIAVAVAPGIFVTYHWFSWWEWWHCIMLIVLLFVIIAFGFFGTYYDIKFPSVHPTLKFSLQVVIFILAFVYYFSSADQIQVNEIIKYCAESISVIWDYDFSSYVSKLIPIHEKKHD